MRASRVVFGTVPFGGAELKVIPPKVREGEKKRREGGGDALRRRFISVCLCTPEESAGAESTRSLFSTPQPPHPPAPASLVSSLSSVIHSTVPEDSQEAGRQEAGLITGGSRTDRETDRKDEPVCNGGEAQLDAKQGPGRPATLNSTN